MQSYDYRSVMAMAEHRYPQHNSNRSDRNRVAPAKVGHYEWRGSVPDAGGPVRRKQRSNDRAPEGSRAA